MVFKQSLKIIQLASYRDNANLAGTRRMFRRNFDNYDLQFTDLEYLEYEPDPRWGGKKFDHEFVRLVNQHDLFVIGGGGFFEIAVDNSVTGTPLDLSAEILQSIEIPIVFYALGVETGYGVSHANLEKFKNFLNYACSRPRTLVSVRNDGSLNHLQALLGDDLPAIVEVIPDGGFFVSPQPYEHAEILPDTQVIALNLAGDNVELRFAEPSAGNLFKRLSRRIVCKITQQANTSNFASFAERLAGALRYTFAHIPRTHLVLIPHIPEDLLVISRFVSLIGPPYSRQCVTVAPYVLGQQAQEYILDIYRRSSLTIGMRFHTNVCSIGMGIPTIGLESAFSKVRCVYDELGLQGRTFHVNDPQLEKKLTEAIIGSLANYEELSCVYQEAVQGLEYQLAAFHYKIKSLIES